MKPLRTRRQDDADDLLALVFTCSSVFLLGIPMAVIAYLWWVR